MFAVLLRNTPAEKHPGTDRVETEDGDLVLGASAPAAHNAGPMTAAATTPDSLSVTPTVINNNIPSRVSDARAFTSQPTFTAVSTV